ncbi:hypothetical protein IF803_19970 [Bradyrhizobium sp. UFLA06-06]
MAGPEQALRTQMRFHLEVASAYAEELHDTRTQAVVDRVLQEVEQDEKPDPKEQGRQPNP